MIFHVPQFIDIEDKIVGPLTWKQLGWMVLMSGILFILWKVLELAFFILSSIPIALLFLALAFYKPYGLTLVRMAYYSLVYMFSAKIYTWHRAPRPRTSKKAPKKKKNVNADAVEVITLDELKDIAHLLDDPSDKAR